MALGVVVQLSYRAGVVLRETAAGKSVVRLTPIAAAVHDLEWPRLGPELPR